MRVLLVAENAPWPATGGGLIRLARAVEAVASVSDLDLCVFHDPGDRELIVPPTVRLHRSIGVPFPRVSPQWRWRSAWALRRGVPLEVVMVEADRAPGADVRRWARPPYDAVWFSTAAAFAWAGRPAFGPTIVDLMDLEDVKARLRAELLDDGRTESGRTDALRARLARVQARRNADDWTRFQHSVAAQVERVVLTSDVDAARSGLANAVVVPNTFPLPAHPAGDPSASAPPVVLFQGSLTYPPNVDAATWLATEIAPRIRDSVPAAEVRLVGTPSTGVRRLDRPGVVSVVGTVPSMEGELARATVAVVPVRYGSGTRIKILESFAHRVPVVSTTVGAEGLDVEDGVHLLVADDPGAIAAAVVRLLADAPLRVRLTEAAASRYLERYSGPVADAEVRRLVAEVARSSTRS